MTDKKEMSDYTKCVVSEKDETRFEGAVVTPIFQTANYRFAKSQDLIDLQEGKTKKYMYARYSNPTVEEVEQKLANLEHGERALIFASGMAASASICLTLLNAGDRLVAFESLYGGSKHLFNKILTRFGVRVDYLTMEELARLPDFLTEPTRLLWFETPVNPNLRVIKMEPIVTAARAKGVITVCDNTFATPINQKPLDWGVDLVMHSASKYLGGHSDLVGGAVVGSSENLARVYETRKFVGGVADPHAAFLINRGLKTLAIRVARQNASALQVAEFLKDHPRVTRVFYPGLPDSPDYPTAQKQMTGFGGMVCLEVEGNLDRAIKVIDSFKNIINATSLGGVESMASLPVLTSQYGHPPEVIRKAGVSESMIRLSVGLEDVVDLVADLDQALNA